MNTTVTIDFNALLAAAYFPTIFVSVVVVFLFLPWAQSLWRSGNGETRARRHLVTGIAVVWVGQLMNAVSQFYYFAEFPHSEQDLRVTAACVVTGRLFLLIGAMFLINGYLVGRRGKNTRIVWPWLAVAVFILYLVAMSVLWPAFLRSQ